VNPQFLQIEIIRSIWKRDVGQSQRNQFSGKSERVKHKARRELSYIWFMEHWQSPYQVYIVPETKLEKVKAVLGLDEDWQEDALLKEAREWYGRELEETNPFIFTLKAAQRSMVEIGMFLNTIKLTGAENRAANGMAVFKPKDITTGIKELSAAQESLRTMEEAVKRAQTVNKRVRGGGAVGMYED